MLLGPKVGWALSPSDPASKSSSGLKQVKGLGDRSECL